MFKSNQTTIKVLRNIFRRLEVRKRVRLMFRRPKENINANFYVITGYKQ